MIGLVWSDLFNWSPSLCAEGVTGLPQLRAANGPVCLFSLKNVTNGQAGNARLLLSASSGEVGTCGTDCRLIGRGRLYSDFKISIDLSLCDSESVAELHQSVTKAP
jgi:hypothetical protein